MQGWDAYNALFWSTEEVHKARAQFAAKDEEEEQKKVVKEWNKASTEAICKQEKKGKKEKAFKRAIAREATKE